MPHAILSCSGSHRWLTCSPSARFELQFPKIEGDAAREGTLAHKLAEILIGFKVGRINKFQLEAKLKPVQAHELYTPAMFEHCNEFAGWVMEQYAIALSHTPSAILLLEEHTDLSAWVPEGYGTRDIAIIGDGIAHVIDFKYGQGVLVEAEGSEPILTPETDDDVIKEATGNPQMLLYALGTWEEYYHIYGLRTVRMTIYQPRLDNISTAEIDRDGLYFWANFTLKRKAEEAFKGLGKFVPGEHCHFCNAAGACKANADFNFKNLSKYEFRNENVLTPSDIEDILNHLGPFMKWGKAVKEYSLSAALSGELTIPNYKIVRGRRNRKYLDVHAVENVLLAAGYKKEYIFKKPELLSVAALEGAISKNKFAEFCAPYVIKTQGIPTIVHTSDKRFEIGSINNALNEFKDLDFSEDDDFI